MKPDSVKGHLDLVLLGVLASKPGHGYAVISTLKQQTGGILDIAEGSVYPALHRLEDLGLVASNWTPEQGRRRREYRLTAKGQTALAAEKKDWGRLSSAINAVLAEAGGPGLQPLAGGPA
jgi:DNA-binding PadR family transcriptional regulator